MRKYDAVHGRTIYSLASELSQISMELKDRNMRLEGNVLFNNGCFYQLYSYDLIEE